MTKPGPIWATGRTSSPSSRDFPTLAEKPVLGELDRMVMNSMEEKALAYATNCGALLGDSLGFGVVIDITLRPSLDYSRTLGLAALKSPHLRRWARFDRHRASTDALSPFKTRPPCNYELLNAASPRFVNNPG
jgi:hypothetical protein